MLYFAWSMQKLLRYHQWRFVYMCYLAGRCLSLRTSCLCKIVCWVSWAATRVNQSYICVLVVAVLTWHSFELVVLWCSWPFPTHLSGHRILFFLYVSAYVCTYISQMSKYGLLMSNRGPRKEQNTLCMDNLCPDTSQNRKRWIWIMSGHKSKSQNMAIMSDG